VSISDRAVKADDAQVDFRPWHLRISLVLPCTLGTLEVLARFVMRRWRSNVVKSFVRYLEWRYGPMWLAHVCQHDRLSTTNRGLKRLASSMSSGEIAINERGEMERRE
jgi:hypothetical protein